MEFTQNAVTTTWSATFPDGANTLRRQKKTCFRTLNDFPPPMPSRLMKKHYTPDGRLVITEEKVERHEYFKACKSNGRLVLDLVRLDNVVEEKDEVEKINGCDECGDDRVDVVQFKAAGCGGISVATTPLRQQIRI